MDVQITEASKILFTFEKPVVDRGMNRLSMRYPDDGIGLSMDDFY